MHQCAVAIQIVVVGVAGAVRWLEKNTRFQEPTPFKNRPH